MTFTIGMFDGVHRGHQAILQHLQEYGEEPVILTFSNHPAEVLKKNSPPILSSLPLKMALFKECGIEKTVVIPFTAECSNLSYEDFLAQYPIRHLVLGSDAALGKNAIGTVENLRKLGAKRGFTVHSIPKLFVQQSLVSSSFIRQLIQSGRLEEAEQLLGRPYCIYYSSDFPPSSIALPPDGEYPVWIHSQSGISPFQITIRNGNFNFLSSVPKLISFGPHLNPNLFEILCQTSPAVL